MKRTVVYKENFKNGDKTPYILTNALSRLKGRKQIQVHMKSFLSNSDIDQFYLYPANCGFKTSLSGRGKKWQKKPYLERQTNPGNLHLHLL